MREQLTCETDISENNRQQQCHTDSADIYPYEGFKALEQALVLLNGDVHVVQAQTDLRQIFYLQYIYGNSCTENEQQRRRHQRNEKHIYI